MNFSKNNCIKSLFCFQIKDKNINVINSFRRFLCYLKKHYPKLIVESSVCRNEKISFYINGVTNINSFLEALLHIDGGYKNLKRKNFLDTPFYFDIEIKNIFLLSRLSKCNNFIDIENTIEQYLNIFEFYITLSNIVFFKEERCLRMFFKNEIDFTFGTIEFSNYVKNNYDSFMFPDIKKPIEEWKVTIKEPPKPNPRKRCQNYKEYKKKYIRRDLKNKKNEEDFVFTKLNEMLNKYHI